MKRKRFTEEQIIGVLREQEGGVSTADVCRRHGISSATFRAECLNAHWFMALDDARSKMEDWRRYYNEERQHSGIGQNVPILLHNPGGASSPPQGPKAGNSGFRRSKVWGRSRGPLLHHQPEIQTQFWGCLEFEPGSEHLLANFPNLNLTCVTGADNYPSKRMILQVPATALRAIIEKLDEPIAATGLKYAPDRLRGMQPRYEHLLRLPG